ncbi:hypothetical protein RBH20_18065 [Haloarcula sp. H-GB4]|uniref:hypothetical protein n=1 Tax=Haloarcula sp. H-GB4 TaxID=3069755 RepID=UPI0027B76793|nr:hypothetical protein [Haloarcula sp. H-GB4]MDQ2074446.1 hypothetical protein [Haloarcula sp. H-GB4]
MSPNKSLLFALVCGLAVGSLVYRFLLPDWFFALGIAAVYAGSVYFYVSFDIPLLGEHITFRKQPYRLGHAIGMFGLTISPLALIEYVELQTAEVAGVLVWTTGVIAYLLLVSTAQGQE